MTNFSLEIMKYRRKLRDTIKMLKKKLSAYMEEKNHSKVKVNKRLFRQTKFEVIHHQQSYIIRKVLTVLQIEGKL